MLRINLTKPLPHAAGPGNDPTRAAPWAIKTTAGKWCIVVTGATGFIAGLHISYQCTGGGVLLGAPRRSTPTWTIFSARSFQANQYTPISISAAWW